MKKHLEAAATLNKLHSLFCWCSKIASYRGPNITLVNVICPRWEHFERQNADGISKRKLRRGSKCRNFCSSSAHCTLGKTLIILQNGTHLVFAATLKLLPKCVLFFNYTHIQQKKFGWPVHWPSSPLNCIFGQLWIRFLIDVFCRLLFFFSHSIFRRLEWARWSF